MLPYNAKLKLRARELRSSMTGAEVFLWTKIRRRQLLGLQFLRQKPIGKYIVDFYCPDASPVIEIDGGQHYTADGKCDDECRDNFLKNLGLSVPGFSNADVLNNVDGVLSTIVHHIESRLTHDTKR